eukprot:1419619-Rhodomonas_salina.1
MFLELAATELWRRRLVGKGSTMYNGNPPSGTNEHRSSVPVRKGLVPCSMQQYSVGVEYAVVPLGWYWRLSRDCKAELFQNIKGIRKRGGQYRKLHSRCVGGYSTCYAALVSSILIVQ